MREIINEKSVDTYLMTAVLPVVYESPVGTVEVLTVEDLCSSVLDALYNQQGVCVFTDRIGCVRRVMSVAVRPERSCGVDLT